MHLFPSEAWCRSLIDAINTDPETPEAGAGWEGDFGAVVLDAPDGEFAVHCRPEGNRIGGFRRLDGLDDLDDLAPAFRMAADYQTWKGMLTGTLDPIEAVLFGKVRFQGSLEPIIARARFREILRRAVARVPTRFED